MFQTATIDDSQGLNRDLAVLLGGGVSAGAVTTVLGLLVGQSVEALAALSFGAIVGLWAYWTSAEDDGALLQLVGCIAAGALMAGLASASWPAAAAAGAIFGAALTHDRFETTAGRLAAWAAFGVALGAAVFTTDALFGHGPTGAGFEPVADVLRAATWGLFVAVPATVARLRFDDDATASRLRRALRAADGDSRDYLEAAAELYTKIRGELSRADQGEVAERARSIATETVEALVRSVERFEDFERDRQPDARLARRIERLDGRIAACRDERLRRELLETRRQAQAQAELRGRLELAGVRLQAHHQRCVTTLEQLHLSLVQHAAAVDRSPVALEASLTELERLCDEVRFKQLSVDELCAEPFEALEQLGDAPELAPPAGGDAAREPAVADAGADGRLSACDDALSVEAEAGADGCLVASQDATGQGGPADPEPCEEHDVAPARCQD